MKSVPPIQKFMSYLPKAVDAGMSIKAASDLMKESDFRHLPVEKNGQLYGLLSDRDIKSVLSFAGTDAEKIKVGDVCEDQPFTVTPTSALDEVAAIMAEKKVGSALVVDNKHLVGIFTITDALKALTEITRQRFH